ncbi:MAG: VWA domain-containing protein [Acidipropionibacterium acidipropionici]|nr:VWA domain-containing protein [Acidipropionibacterium acidipropionici]
MDEALARRGIRRARGRGGIRRTGGRGASELTTFDWLDDITRLFPTETVERLERDAVERFQIDDLLTDPEVLARVEPSTAMLKAVLRTKHLMNPQVLQAARRLVRRVIDELMERLTRRVRTAFTGARTRTPTRVRNSRNFDLGRTLRANLRHYDPVHRRVVISEPLFVARDQRRLHPWQVILLVDQSDSMAGSVIHSAVTAACLWGLPGIRTHLVAFDTEVVDLTRDVTDPVELLMKVHLGGGTDIGRAVQYGAQLIDNPRRAVVVLITDLYEGGAPGLLVQQVSRLLDQGSVVLVLAALDDEGTPEFDHGLGQRLADLGARVGAMTPGRLAEFLAATIGGS